MEHEWDEKHLNQLRIHELRELARTLGVKSPTSQKKDILINKMLAIISGDEEPYVPKNLKGRPVRKYVDSNSLINFFLPNDINENLVDYYDTTESIKFDYNVAMPNFEYNAEVNASEPAIVEGYVDIKDNDFGVLRVNGFNTDPSDVYINKVICTKYHLHSGDYVVGTAQKQGLDKPRTIIEIESINRENPYKRENVNANKPKVESKKGFKLGKYEIMYGTNCVILNQERSSFESTKKFVNELEQLTEAQIVMAAPVTDNVFYNDVLSRVTYATYNISTDYLNAFSAFKIAYGRARTLSNDNNVVLVLSGAAYFLRALSVIISSKEANSFKIEEASKQILFDMFSKASATSAGSLTILFYETTKQESKMLDFVKYELGNMSKLNLVKDNKEYILD